MGFDGNNSVHTLFLIFNTLSPFVFGVFLFAYGVGRGVLVGATGGLGACAAVGAALAILAAVGYGGALRYNYKMLYTYAWMTAGCAGFEVVHLAILGANVLPNPNDLGLQAFYVTMICIIATSIVSVSLAGILAIRLRAAGAGAAARR